MTCSWWALPLKFDRRGGSGKVGGEGDEAEADFKFDARADEVVAGDDVCQETGRAAERSADRRRAAQVPHGAGAGADIETRQRCEFLCVTHRR